MLSDSAFEARKKLELNALEEFRKAFLYLIILVFVIIPIAVVVAAMLFIFVTTVNAPGPSNSSPYDAIILLSAIISIAILGIYSVYLYYIYRGFKLYEKIEPKVSNAILGIYIILSALIGSVVLDIAIPILGISGGATIPLFYVGFTSSLISIVLTAIIIIGKIFIGMEFHRIGNRYDSDAIKIGAFIYILIDILGVILLYIGVKDAIDKVKRRIPPPPPPPWI